MTRLRSIAIASAFAATAVFGLPSAASAHPDDTCARYDEASGGGCANCMKREWTGHDWRLVDTCIAGHRTASSAQENAGW